MNAELPYELDILSGQVSDAAGPAGGRRLGSGLHDEPLFSSGLSPAGDVEKND